ncbi:MAG: discoidin domain-containing protein, partial [Clostridia bacterium]|nr:discoidin domain-containing protein [Clostridia bacterium]
MKSHFLKAYCLLLIALLLFGQADLTLVGLSNANSADTNIAIGRSVTVSSVWDDPEGAWRSRFLTDGSKMESWPLPEGESLGWRSQKHSRREVSITATVDLEGKASVCGIKLYPRGNGAICFPSDYELSLSIDGSQWQSVATVTGDTLRNEVRAFDFPSEHARYVRLTVTRLSEEKDGNDRVCEISEFEIYGSYTKELILMKDNLWLSVGGSERILPSSVNTNLDSVAYTSLDPSVAAVSEDGTVMGMSEGSTEITVADEASGLSATCSVKVGGKKPSNIMITVPVWGNEFAITKQQFAWMQEADIDGVMAVGPDNSAENADKMLSIAQEIWDPALERNLGVFIYT